LGALKIFNIAYFIIVINMKYTTMTTKSDFLSK